MTPKSCQAPISTIHLPATTRNGLARNQAFAQVSPQVRKTAFCKMVSEQGTRPSQEGTKWQLWLKASSAESTWATSSRRCFAALAGGVQNSPSSPSLSRAARTQGSGTASRTVRRSVTTGRRTATSAEARTRSLGFASSTAPKSRSNSEAARASCCLLSGGRGPFRARGVLTSRDCAAQSLTATSRAAHTLTRDLFPKRAIWPEGFALKR